MNPSADLGKTIADVFEWQTDVSEDFQSPPKLVSRGGVSGEGQLLDWLVGAPREIGIGSCRMASLVRRLSQSPAFNLLVVLTVIGLLMLVRLDGSSDRFSLFGIQQEIRQTGMDAPLPD